MGYIGLGGGERKMKLRVESREVLIGREWYFRRRWFGGRGHVIFEKS